MEPANNYTRQLHAFATACGRRGYLWRHRDPSGVSGTGHVADVVVLPEGDVMQHWLPGRRKETVVSLGNIAEVEAISGHGRATELLWHDAWHFGTEPPANVDPAWVWVAGVPGSDTYPLDENDDAVEIMVLAADDPHDAIEHERLGPAQIPEHLRPGAIVALRAWMAEHNPEPGTDVYLWTDYRTPEAPPVPKAEPIPLPLGTMSASDDDMRNAADALQTLARLAHRVAKRLGPDAAHYELFARIDPVGLYRMMFTIDGRVPPLAASSVGPGFAGEGEK